jgi:hypothetical protein
MDQSELGLPFDRVRLALSEVSEKVRYLDGQVRKALQRFQIGTQDTLSWSDFKALCDRTFEHNLSIELQPADSGLNFESVASNSYEQLLRKQRSVSHLSYNDLTAMSTEKSIATSNEVLSGVTVEKGLLKDAMVRVHRLGGSRDSFSPNLSSTGGALSSSGSRHQQQSILFQGDPVEHSRSELNSRSELTILRTRLAKLRSGAAGTLLQQASGLHNRSASTATANPAAGAAGDDPDDQHNASAAIELDDANTANAANATNAADVASLAPSVSSADIAAARAQEIRRVEARIDELLHGKKRNIREELSRGLLKSSIYTTQDISSRADKKWLEMKQARDSRKAAIEARNKNRQVVARFSSAINSECRGITRRLLEEQSVQGSNEVAHRVRENKAKEARTRHNIKEWKDQIFLEKKYKKEEMDRALLTSIEQARHEQEEETRQKLEILRLNFGSVGLRPKLPSSKIEIGQDIQGAVANATNYHEWKAAIDRRELWVQDQLSQRFTACGKARFTTAAIVDGLTPGKSSLASMSQQQSGSESYGYHVPDHEGMATEITYDSYMNSLLAS